MDRREYSVETITINKTSVSKVVIDPHYEIGHSDHINDQLVLELVRKLDGRIEVPESIDDEFSYFATLLMLNDKQYKLVWLLEESEIYVGVLTVYRDDRSK